MSPELPCHICGKPKGQPPACPGHYSKTPSDPILHVMAQQGHTDLIPPDAEVFRASGDCLCETCKRPYYDHDRYRYEWGDGYCVKACDGRYLHL